jgi:hypothetical protein
MKDLAMVASNFDALACGFKGSCRPPLAILAELCAIEQEILQGIEELEEMLR